METESYVDDYKNILSTGANDNSSWTREGKIEFPSLSKYA